MGRGAHAHLRQRHRSCMDARRPGAGTLPSRAHPSLLGGPREWRRKRRAAAAAGARKTAAQRLARLGGAGRGSRADARPCLRAGARSGERCPRGERERGRRADEAPCGGLHEGCGRGAQSWSRAARCPVGRASGGDEGRRLARLWRRGVQIGARQQGEDRLRLRRQLRRGVGARGANGGGARPRLSGRHARLHALAQPAPRAGERVRAHGGPCRARGPGGPWRRDERHQFGSRLGSGVHRPQLHRARLAWAQPRGLSRAVDERRCGQAACPR
mmetsp:Transcript_6782/g.17591  ORF Transcript_6782/g.17591 Transcript_6782/m.17591 type:complete len:272 (-) Transcript_6782:393-1208(-)